jgi:phosphoglycolate phosphatase
MAVSALVVFDLDGTLVDSRLDLAHSVNDVLAGYGSAALPVDQVAAMVGDGARMLVRRALEAASLDAPVDDALARFFGVYDRRLLEYTRPYAGIPEVVRAAETRAALAVLTNKPERPARRLLDAFGLAVHFTWVLGGDSPFPRKPDPASLRHLMSQAGATECTTLLVGDSMIDVETARRAGVAVCVARYGFGHLRGGLTLRGDELVADSPAEVATRIEHWADAAGRAGV